MRTTSIRALIFRILMVLYILSVMFLCFNNMQDLSKDLPKTIFGIPMDKIAHFCMFFPFPILGFFSFDHSKWSLVKTVGRILELASFGIIFAGLTELGQSMLPYRSQDIADFRADSIAICLASLIVFIVDIFIIKHQKKK